MDNALIVFLKYPEPGRVKTRLAKDIGAEKACRIYKSLAENVIKHIFSKNQRTYDVHIFFTPVDKKNEIAAWLKPLIGSSPEAGIHYMPQEGTTLGERMSNAFRQTLQGRPYKRILTQNHPDQITPPISPPSQGGDFVVVVRQAFGVSAQSNAHHARQCTLSQSKGQSNDERGVKNLTKTCPHVNEWKKVSPCNTIIIGTDCPGIDATLIENAFKILNKKDVVIGPCKDGGYYLLGMSRLVPDLFSGIDWGTDRVFDQTMEKIQKNDLSFDILKTLVDIDTQEDLYQSDLL